MVHELQVTNLCTKGSSNSWCVHRSTTLFVVFQLGLNFEKKHSNKIIYPDFPVKQFDYE